MAIDTGGNVLVAGSMADKLAFGNDELTSAGADDMFAAKYDGKGRRLWVKRFGGANVDAFHGVAVGEGGTSYWIGVFRDQISTQGQKVTSAGKADVLLLKLDSSGSLLWLRSLGAAGDDYGRALAVDSQGDLLVACEFSEVLQLADTTLTSGGNRDIALIKLSPEGELRWAKSYGSTMDELVFGITVDPADNISFTGSFDDTIRFDSKTLAAQGQADIFVTQLSPEGLVRWAHSFGGKREDIGYAVTSDAFGTIFATGWFRDTADFGQGPLKSKGKKDIFLLEIDSKGSVKSSQQFGNLESDLGKGIAVLADGVALAGTIVMDVAFGAKTIGTPRQEGERIPRGNAFVARFTQ